MTYIFMRAPTRSLTALLLSSSLIVTGCSSTGGAPVSPISALSGSAKYDVASDPCNRFRQPLRDSKDYFTQSLVQGALVGAVLGGLTGALIGARDGNAARGALIGAGAGLLGGLAAGYLNAKRQQNQDQAALEAAINSDAGVDNARLNTFATAIDEMHVCRMQQTANLRSRAVSRQIDRASAEAELAAIRSQSALDYALIEEVLGKAVERNDVYADALASSQGVTRPVQTYQPAVVRQTVVIDAPVYAPYEPAPVAIQPSAPTYTVQQPAQQTVAITPAPSYEQVTTVAIAPAPQYESVDLDAPVPVAPQASIPAQVSAPQPVQVAAVPPGRTTMEPIRDDPVDRPKPRVVQSTQSIQIASAAAAARQGAGQGNQTVEGTIALGGMQKAVGEQQGQQMAANDQFEDELDSIFG